MVKNKEISLKIEKKLTELEISSIKGREKDKIHGKWIKMSSLEQQRKLVKCLATPCYHCYEQENRQGICFSCITCQTNRENWTWENYEVLVEIVEQERIEKEKKEVVNSTTEENVTTDQLPLTSQSAGVGLVLVGGLVVEIVKKYVK